MPFYFYHPLRAEKWQRGPGVAGAGSLEARVEYLQNVWQSDELPPAALQKTGLQSWPGAGHHLAAYTEDDPPVLGENVEDRVGPGPNSCSDTVPQGTYHLDNSYGSTVSQINDGSKDVLCEVVFDLEFERTSE